MICLQVSILKSEARKYVDYYNKVKRISLDTDKTDVQKTKIMKSDPLLVGRSARRDFELAGVQVSQEHAMHACRISL